MAVKQSAVSLRGGALAALRVLQTCPLVPVDVFMHLAGLTSMSAAYQQLARLERAGLAEVQRVDPGYLVGERRIGCWTISGEGRRLLDGSEGRSAARAGSWSHTDGRHDRKRRPVLVRQGDLPLRIAAYRMLAFLVYEAAEREEGQPVVSSWEWPWVRHHLSPARAQALRVSVPAGVSFGRIADEADSHSSVLLVPDLGTAPVAHYTQMLHRLATLQEATLDDGSGQPDLRLVIATPDPDGSGTREDAWLGLLERVARRHQSGLVPRLVRWEQVANVLGRSRVAVPATRSAPTSLGLAGPARSHQQLLHLVGRHPFLSVDQLGQILGTSADRIRRLEQELIDSGLLRCIEFAELPDGALGLPREDWANLGLVEVTMAGRRRVAGWLGLTAAAASGYHGLVGQGRGLAGRRWRLLRTLAHTLGTNAVFVALAMGAEAVRRAGGSDQLAEWRSAAACERHDCKPDGYGCYVRDGVAHGFFLEYDRGTERGRRYAAKFRAYYRYRDSGRADRDYDGFPTVLFVTTQAAAEQRIADQAHREWFVRGTEPLPVLITTTDRIRQHPEGILGPIWRLPEPAVSAAGLERGYWLPGGPPRGRFGLVRQRLQVPRLVWPTAGEARRRDARTAAGGGRDANQP